MNDLAREVKRVRDERGWSLRDAQDATGINFSTVRNMSRGDRVGPEFLIRWARAAGEPIAYWLRLGGHDDMAEIYEETAAPTAPLPKLIPRGMAEPEAADDAPAQAEPGEEPQEFPPEIAQALQRIAAFKGAIDADGWSRMLRDLDDLISRTDSDIQLRRELEDLRRKVKGDAGE